MTTTIPDRNTVNCIWMDAGVVGYKLCDRNLQCEQCPFDTSMRRPSHAASEQAKPTAVPGSIADAPISVSMSDRVAALVDTLAADGYPDDRLYHQGHLWVKPLVESIVSIGIDHVAAAMLGSLASIVLPSRQSKIIHRMPWCWLIHHEGAISLYSPVHGIVVESNTRLIDHPELLVQDPYGQGWLAHVQVDQSAAERPALCTSPEYRSRAEQERIALRAAVLQSLRKSPPIGQTLHDGGRPAETLASMLGGKAFFKITATLFAP